MLLPFSHKAGKQLHAGSSHKRAVSRRSPANPAEQPRPGRTSSHALPPPRCTELPGHRPLRRARPRSPGGRAGSGGRYLPPTAAASGGTQGVCRLGWETSHLTSSSVKRQFGNSSTVSAGTRHRQRHPRPWPTEAAVSRHVTGSLLSGGSQACYPGWLVYVLEKQHRCVDLT